MNKINVLINANKKKNKNRYNNEYRSMQNLLNLIKKDKEQSAFVEKNLSYKNQVYKIIK